MEDCKVCKQLIKEKHRRDIWWKVFCIIFGALSLIFGILYFGSGAVVEENQIEIWENDFTNNGDNGNIIIGSDNTSINSDFSGTVEKKDYTPIICITIIAGVAILVCGGVLIANHAKKDN